MAAWGQGDPRWLVEHRDDGKNVNGESGRGSGGRIALQFALPKAVSFTSMDPCTQGSHAIQCNAGGSPPAAHAAVPAQALRAFVPALDQPPTTDDQKHPLSAPVRSRVPLPSPFNQNPPSGWHWEEKDRKEWTKARLAELFSGQVLFSAPEGGAAEGQPAELRVERLKDLTGDVRPGEGGDEGERGGEGGEGGGAWRG